jgi:hypothetical protein
VSSGAEGLEAAVVVSEEPLLKEASVRAVRDLAETAPVYRADPWGVVHEVSE